MLRVAEQPLQPAVASKPPALVSTTTSPAIETHGLGKWIDDRIILRDIDLTIGAGEYVALLGANGAGKTTLLRILASLTAPSRGTVNLFGAKLTRSAIDLRARIGLIGHQSMLYRDLSARENLAFFAKLYGIDELQRRIGQMLDVVGLADRADDPVKSFSRGMVQRVSIARALLHNPELILADEPFAGLDAPSIESLELLLSRLHAKARKTIVLVTHDIEQSLRLASRAIVLRGGVVVTDQPADKLYARELISEVIGS